MSAHVFSASSSIHARHARKPQLARAAVVPQAHARRHGFRKPLDRPSLMALSPLDALFDFSPSHLVETEDFARRERARVMAVDFVEDSQGFQIKADIPGVAKSDIKLDVDHNVLTISAKRSNQSSSDGIRPGDTSADDDSDPQAEVVEEDSSEEKTLQNNANVLRYERYDMFQSRSFRVPKTADLKTISAKYEDGVLTVDVKKREDVMEAKRTVAIK